MHNLPLPPLPQSGDLRAVPQLIELLASPDRTIQSAGRQALGKITLGSELDMTLEFAKNWWARHNRSSQDLILTESLSDPDPLIRLNAVRRLSTDRWDARAMSTLIRLVEEGEGRVLDTTSFEIKRITGNDWGFDRKTSKEDRKRIADLLRDWWRGESGSFVPLALRGKITAQPASSQVAQWIRSLSDSEQADAATANIRSRGDSPLANSLA